MTGAGGGIGKVRPAAVAGDLVLWVSSNGEVGTAAAAGVLAVPSSWGPRELNDTSAMTAAAQRAALRSGVRVGWFGMGLLAFPRCVVKPVAGVSGGEQIAARRNRCLVNNEAAG